MVSIRPAVLATEVGRPLGPPCEGRRVSEITVTMWTTIDGYVAGPRGEIDWILGDHQLAAYELAAVADRDTLLLGRSTYEDFAGYWPVAAESSEDEFERDHGRNMTSTRKVVASTTLTDPVWVGRYRGHHLPRRRPPPQAGEREGDPDLRQPQPRAPAVRPEAHRRVPAAGAPDRPRWRHLLARRTVVPAGPDARGPAALGQRDLAAHLPPGQALRQVLVVVGRAVAHPRDVAVELSDAQVSTVADDRATDRFPSAGGGAGFAR